MRLVSLRLMPPAFRVDLFTPAAWATVAQNRKLRREEMQEILDHMGRQPALPTIMGGDFNAQSGDPSLNEVNRLYADAFYRSGAGWGHTAVNEFPLARIDRVFTSGPLNPKVMRVIQTEHSDHRMVVLDLAWP